MKKLSLLIPVFALLSGCIALKIDPSRLTEIDKHGFASLQPSSQDGKASILGPRLRRFYAVSVDNPKQTINKFDTICELAPGSRHLTIAAVIADPIFGGQDTKTAQVQVILDTHLHGHYRVDGKILNDNLVKLWITDLDSDIPATNYITAELTSDRYIAPAIPLPVKLQ